MNFETFDIWNFVKLFVMSLMKCSTQLFLIFGFHQKAIQILNYFGIDIIFWWNNCLFSILEIIMLVTTDRNSYTNRFFNRIQKWQWRSQKLSYTQNLTKFVVTIRLEQRPTSNCTTKIKIASSNYTRYDNTSNF